MYARTDPEADSKAQQLSPAVASEGAAVSINIAALDGARADLVLTVPAAAAIRVTANRGDIHVASIKAPVAATANRGDIELSAITGPATAHINSGGSSISAHSMGSGIAIEGHAQDVTLSEIAAPSPSPASSSAPPTWSTSMEQSTSTPAAPIQVARLDGEAEITPRSDLSQTRLLGPLVLTTSNRNISLDRISGAVAVTDRNGTIDLTAAPPLGPIDMEDRNGSVKLILPEHAGFSVQANTTNGEISTDFPLPPPAAKATRTSADRWARAARWSTSQPPIATSPWTREQSRRSSAATGSA